MSVIDNEEIRCIILEKYELAKSSCVNESQNFGQDVSNNIPKYDIKEMKFGAYNKDNFVSFFADMRGSSIRAENIGEKDTFLTIHAIMPAMIYVVEQYGGSIVDLPGDGIMALFKDNIYEIYWYKTGQYLNSEELAVCAGRDFLKVIKEIVNPILEEDNILPVEFGVGIDTGNVIVTKVGTDNIRDIKAIGRCINGAAKRSGCKSKIFITSNVYKKLSTNLQEEFIEVDDRMKKTYQDEIKEFDGYINDMGE